MSQPTTHHRHAKRVNDDGPVDVFISRSPWSSREWMVDVYRAGTTAPVEDTKKVPTKELAYRWAEAKFKGRIDRIGVTWE